MAPRRARPVIQGPTYRAPRYHSRLGGRLIFLVFVLLLALVIGSGGGLFWLLHRAQGSSSGTVTLHVGAGEGVTEIADTLKSMGLIDSTLLFRLDARIQNLGGKLKVGDYYLRKNMSIDQMVSTLQQYTPTGITVTIPEGWRAEQIAARLTSDGFDGRGFLSLVRHPTPGLLQFLRPLGILQDKPSWAGLEGYLFPDTYRLSPGQTAQAIIRQMVQDLDSKFRAQPQLTTVLLRQKRSIFGVLKLASIVEREARLAPERALIAGVYWNRLRLGWFLDADPTVQYTLGQATPLNTVPTAAHKWWPVLTNQAASVKSTSLFNTYTHKGLPPTPIADAGWSSIQAAIHPAPTTYMYFVAVKHGHGRHVFARTLAEQQANQARYG
jgi:UPF0755 protein